MAEVGVGEGVGVGVGVLVGARVGVGVGVGVEVGPVVGVGVGAGEFVAAGVVVGGAGTGGEPTAAAICRSAEATEKFQLVGEHGPGITSGSEQLSRLAKSRKDLPEFSE